jgi:alpha-tubulin suppressor-like RCC1 family protein
VNLYGSLVSWGLDNYNQVTDTPAGNDFNAIAAGARHALVLKSDGSIVGWGGLIRYFLFGW